MLDRVTGRLSREEFRRGVRAEMAKMVLLSK